MTTQTDLVWALPMFLAALLLLATAALWWRVGNGKVMAGQKLPPTDSDLRLAASATAISLGLLALALLGLFWTRL